MKKSESSKLRLSVCGYIDSAHYLPGMSPCDNPHGHTYKVEVVIEGKCKNGIVMDFREIKRKLKDVLQMLDHKDLNKLMTFPSCENICLFIYRELKKQLPGIYSVRVWEGHDKWVEVCPNR